MVVVSDTANIEWLSTSAAADRLGVTPRTLYRFINDGNLPAYRIGRVIRLQRGDVDAFIDASRITPRHAPVPVTAPAAQPPGVPVLRGRP